MNTIEKILRDYTEGTASLEDTNAKLLEAGFWGPLDPKRHEITDAERTTHGLLDTGTGTLDKVRVVDGKRLEHAVNKVQADGSINMDATVYYNGVRYDVRGAELVGGV